MGYSVYKHSQANNADTRDTEYRLLAQVTAALMSVKDKADADIRERVDIALWNRDVWAALKADLSSEGNNLPHQLRTSLISIASWVEKECMRIVEGQGDLNALIEVNRNIMAGLKPHQSGEHQDEGQNESSGESDMASTFPTSEIGSFAAAI